MLKRWQSSGANYFNMIRIFKFKKNDLNPSGGKQIEYSISDVKDFWGFTSDEVRVDFTYQSVNPDDALTGFRFSSTFKLSPARGDYKCYGNTDGSINLKSFFLDKLHLDIEHNLSDSYALKKVGDTSYIITYIPASIPFDKIAKFFYSDNTDTSKDEDGNPEQINIKFPLQQIYYGAPGTGKSFTIDDMTDDTNSVRTTFHPDSDYASFVGAYKPTMENVPINSIYGESVQFATGKNGHPGTEKKIVYKYVPQAFLKAYVAAWSNLDTPYFLIIEEINRGNCAQIFGDLFQLLDRNNAGSSSYAIHADEDISQFLSGDNKGFASLSDDQKDAIRSFTLEKDNGKTQAVGQDILDGKLLLLPPNLYIWATMNTSDQSLFPIDSAFKRRWNWKYMPIEYSPLDKKTQLPIDWKFKIGDNLYSWGQFLSKINPEIYALTESSDKQMGYFFAKADNATGIISEDVFLNKVLFYLWTDVFKDFDVSSELFKNKKANRSFRFTDFFEDSEALSNFIDNLGLDVVDIDIDTVEDEDSPEDPSTSSNPSQRDRSKYSINGEGKNNKRQTVLRSLRKFVENNPELTAREVIEKWKSVNPEIPFFILTTTEFENRISEMPGQRNRYWSVTVGNGERVYITNQWGAGRMSGFVNLINNSDLGIHIEKVSE